jgi:DNA-binding NarL/FixJ family response regulator
VIRLVLADDHPVFAAGLRTVLDAEEDMQVAAVATTGRQALQAVIDDHPDIAILDLSMPDGDGLGVCSRVREAGLPTKVLILTMSDEDENVLAALRAGAYGYAVKGAGPDEIVAVVRAPMGKRCSALVSRRGYCSTSRERRRPRPSRSSQSGSMRSFG